MKTKEIMEIKECCETCKYGCLHGNGESLCLYRQKWQFSEFRCAGYKPNLRTVWKRFIEWLYKIKIKNMKTIEEMRDAFYNNFKELIEICKELL